MPRPRQFDCDEALEKAMQVFNEKGYEAAFLDDLTAAMGINRPSLYNTFGDKHSLYMTALAHYRDAYRQVLTEIGEAATAKEGFEAFFAHLIEGASAEKCRGCMMVGSVIESPTIGGDIQVFVRETDAQLKGILATIIKTAQVGGDVSPDKDSEALASYLYSAIQGLQVRVKAGDTKRELEAIARLAITVLD